MSVSFCGSCSSASKQAAIFDFSYSDTSIYLLYIIFFLKEVHFVDYKKNLVTLVCSTERNIPH